MELEEIKDLWSTQNSKPSYTINEKAMNHQIDIKKRKILHITNFSELLLIGVNVGSGIFVLVMTAGKRASYFLYAIAVWMFVTAFYVIATRVQRIHREKVFDRSIRGELDCAISTANSQVQMSRLMRWNVIPIGALAVLSTWDGGKSLWIAVGIAVFFGLTFYLSGWEHNIYVSKKAELEGLKQTLLQDEQIT